MTVSNQIPLEVTVDVESNESVENLSKSEEVNKLLNLMKEPATKLEKEWKSLHYQLKHLPHSKMMRLAEAGNIDKKFLKIDKLRCPHCIISTQARKHSR